MDVHVSANNLIAVFTSDASINYAGFNSSVYARQLDISLPFTVLAQIFFLTE